MPVAVKLMVVPVPTVGSTGPTWIAVSVPAVTVSIAVPEAPRKVAVMVALPARAAVATPPAATVATVTALDVQVAEIVTSWCVPSDSVASAVKEMLVPTAVVTVAGRMAMAVTPRALTVIDAVAESVPTVAVMVAVPAATAVTTPAALTPAIVDADEVNVAPAVTSPRVPSV